MISVIVTRQMSKKLLDCQKTIEYVEDSSQLLSELEREKIEGLIVDFTIEPFFETQELKPEMSNFFARQFVYSQISSYAKSLKSFFMKGRKYKAAIRQFCRHFNVSIKKITKNEIQLKREVTQMTSDNLFK